MEELKLLVSMVANLPSMALWVIAFFFIYKVSIIGSIYGVIRLAIQRFYDYGISENAITKKEIIRQEIHFEDLINGIVVSGESAKFNFISLLKYFAQNNTLYKGSHIHQSHIDWLKEAIDEKISKDIKNGKALKID